MNATRTKPVAQAVMAQRFSGTGLDRHEYFPTPPWGTRALCEHILDLCGQSVWEPACGGGHMARALAEYAACVVASDIVPRGFGTPFDFLALESPHQTPSPFAAVDWIITNPPFRHVGDFIRIGLSQARRGIAMLGRLQLLEGIERWHSIWKPWCGHITVAPFVERLPMEEGLVAPDTSTATAYAWLVINKHLAGQPPLRHIPPCRTTLEKPGDYDPFETIQAVRALKADRMQAQRGGKSHHASPGTVCG